MGASGRGGNLAWRLTWSADYLEEDLQSVEQSPEIQRSYGLSFVRLFDLPNPMRFAAISDTVTYKDYLYNDVRWPIMSKHMLEILCSLGGFPHRSYPVQVVRDNVVLENLELMGVQLLVHHDYFDWERSVYEHDGDQDIAVGIEEFVLNVPDGEFPPLFRLSASPTSLFVSDRARQALREAGIRGTAYLPLDGFETQVDLSATTPDLWRD